MLYMDCTTWMFVQYMDDFNDLFYTTATIYE